MQKPELKSLTGVRAFAAMWVVLFHLRGTIADFFLTPQDYLLSLLGGGNNGVDLFFVLSGFVLTYNYHDAFPALTANSYGKFLWQRLARIYPVHILGIAMWAMFLLANSFLRHQQPIAGNYSGKALIAQLFLVQAWSIPDQFSWNYPAWSISMEWLAYLCFPFLTVFLVKHRGSVVWPCAAICVLGLGAPFLMELPAEHLIRIGSEFTTGCLLHLLYVRGVGKQWLGRWAASATLLMILIFAGQLGHFVLPFFIVLIYSLLFDRGPAAALFSSRWCMYGGRISYSLYMLHAAIISACHFVLPVNKYLHSAAPVKFAVIGAYLTAIVSGGILAYHFVEEPCRRKMLQWVRFQRAKEIALPAR